ncbi:MAG: GNAT family N-acetyltransferase [Bifidobacterium sp.]
MNGKMLRIRRISASYNRYVKTIVREGLARFGLDIPGTAYYDPQLEDLNDFYESDSADLGRAYYVVVDEDERVIGGAGYAHFSGLAPDIAELQKLYVTPEGQGYAVSYRLIETIEKAAREDGYRMLYLETHHALVAAMHVYERSGFQLLDEPLAQPSHDTMDRFYLKVIG